jgi:hypothetical protein
MRSGAVGISRYPLEPHLLPGEAHPFQTGLSINSICISLIMTPSDKWIEATRSGEPEVAPQSFMVSAPRNFAGVSIAAPLHYGALGRCTTSPDPSRI